MKKLTKINLHGAQIMNDAQLKQILGGADGGDAETEAGYPKVDSCIGKKENSECSWKWNGTTQYGRCRAYAPDYTLHCSDLI